MTINTNPEKLLKSLRPMMVLAQVMGITFPAYLQEKRYKFTLTYRIVVLAGLTLALIREIPSSMFWSRNLKGVHGMLAFIETRLRWAVLIINFLLTTFNNQNINKTIASLVNSPLILKQKEYNRIFKLQIWLLIFTLGEILCFMVLAHDIIWMNPYYRWFSSTLYLVTEFYMGFSNFQFVTLLIVIKKYYAALNENLNKCDFQPEISEKGETSVFFITKGCSQDNVLEIVKFRQAHMNLTTACRKTNQCFSLQILFFLVVSLIEITYSLRAITVYSFNNSTPETEPMSTRPMLEMILIFFWGGYYIYSILELIVSCETTVLESTKTGVVVHELMNTVKDKEMERQLQLFSMQLMNHRACFSAGKFVILNYALLNSIVGTIITYLVIIITFSI